MRFVPMSLGRHTVRVVEILVHGVVRVLTLLFAAAVFVPTALVLPLWPFLSWERVRGLLEFFRDWTLSVVRARDPGWSPDAGPDEEGHAGTLRSFDTETG